MRIARLLLVLTLLAMGTVLTILPAGAVEPGNSAFQNTWARTDMPVADTQVSRTWMWGPSAFTSAMEEWFVEGPNGSRVVQYYDKTRMEITDPNADPNSIWYVTNGRLAWELVTGEMQVGLDEFETREPAQVNVAGDAQDPNGPLYASFTGLLGAEPLSDGAAVTQRISRDGSVTDDPALAGQGITAAYHVPETNHSVASPFWAFMNSQGTIWENGAYVDGALFPNPFYATGFPITEAYWANVLVGGTERLVLIQVFERRVLTYTPDNPEGWQVEAGNVGQHYYRWRYNAEIPTEPPPIEAAEYQPIGPVLPPDWPIDHQGQALFSFGNQAPYPMTVTLDGPTSESFTLDPCPDCPVYTSPSEVTECRQDIAWQDVTLPPGNYRLQISWEGAGTPLYAGPHTLVPNAQYGSCYFIIETMTIQSAPALN